MVGSKTDEIGDEPQIGATQVFPQKCQNKARGHSLKLQTVVGCSVDCLRVMGEMIMFMQCLCILFEITFHLHSNGTFAEYYGQKKGSQEKFHVMYSAHCSENYILKVFSALDVQKAFCKVLNDLAS